MSENYVPNKCWEECVDSFNCEGILALFLVWFWRTENSNNGIPQIGYRKKTRTELWNCTVGVVCPLTDRVFVLVFVLKNIHIDICHSPKRIFAGLRSLKKRKVKIKFFDKSYKILMQTEDVQHNLMTRIHRTLWDSLIYREHFISNLVLYWMCIWPNIRRNYSAKYLAEYYSPSIPCTYLVFHRIFCYLQNVLVSHRIFWYSIEGLFA